MKDFDSYPHIATNGHGPDWLALLADDKEMVAYRPRWNVLTGGVMATIFLQQVVYWWVRAGRKPFFKFAGPCKHRAYRAGDSWREELGFSRRELETARKGVGVRTKGNLDGAALVSYWVDVGHKTWYALNEGVLLKGLERVYPQQKGGAGIQLSLLGEKGSGSDVRNAHQLMAEVNIRPDGGSEHQLMHEVGIRSDGGNEHQLMAEGGNSPDVRSEHSSDLIRSDQMDDEEDEERGVDSVLTLSGRILDRLGIGGEHFERLNQLPAELVVGGYWYVVCIPKVEDVAAYLRTHLLSRRRTPAPYIGLADWYLKGGVLADLVAACRMEGKPPARVTRAMLDTALRIDKNGGFDDFLSL